MNKRDNLKGTKIFSDIQNLATTQYFVIRNYQELENQIMPYEKDIGIWEVSKRDKFQAFLRELSRLIHNYLSSTFSLISHSSNFCDQLHNKNLRKEYDEMVAKLKLYDCYHFVKDLRRFNQHIGLPLISAQLDIHPKDSNGFQSRILFDKKILLSWQGNNAWTSGSKNYLNTHQEIEVKAVFSEYQGLIKEFYDWFYKKTSSVYANELKEFLDNELEIGRLWQLQEVKNQANAKK